MIFAAQFSKDDSFIYLTAGDEAKIKIFALPVPPTPSHSTTHPKLGRKYQKPVAITHSKAVSDIQVLPDHRILFTQSSFTSPNDVFVASRLKSFEDAAQAEDATASTKIKIDQITDFSRDELKGKSLSEGEEFWFKGALQKDVQGWALKPKGWKAGDKKKWPAVLLIHGGTSTYIFSSRSSS